MKNISEIRPSPIAGSWYSDDPQKLASQVDRYIQAARLPAIEGRVIAIMAPHAGHRYSGAVAGYAFAALCGMSPQVITVVSPMHYPYTEALLTTAHQAYATPLGSIPVDLENVDRLDQVLRKKSGYSLARVANDPEHSLEIELPFLQRSIQSSFKLLPVMVRDSSRSVARALGAALAEVLQGQNALLLASTDLSHFYTQSTAEKLDSTMLDQVAQFSPEGVLQVEEEGRGFACGKGALAAVMWAARQLGADSARVLHHATSGNVTGDYSQVVGYAAAVFTRKVN
jgi:hypothetical protein